MASWPRTIVPFEVTSLEMPGPLISKAQSGRVNLRATQQIGRTWTERYLVNVRSVNGRALLAFVDNVWRNGTTFTIDHRDHLTPLGTGGGSPLINQPTQLVANPENFGAWTLQGTPVRTSGQSDPYGTTNAYLLDDDDAGTLDEVFVSPTFTGDGSKAFSVFLRQGTSSTNLFGFFDVTAATWRHLVKVTWTAGVPALSTSLGSGTMFPVESFGGGWFRLSANASGIVAANSNSYIIAMTDVTAALLGTVYAFGANTWNSITPAGYIGPSHPAATGNTLYLDGATASVSNWLRAGDIVGVGGLASVYEVTADTSSQANGFVALPINPPIFTGGAPGDNAVVTITAVTLTACILEPPTFPTTSGPSADYGELVCKFSESL